MGGIIWAETKHKDNKLVDYKVYEGGLITKKFEYGFNDDIKYIYGNISITLMIWESVRPQGLRGPIQKRTRKSLVW